MPIKSTCNASSAVPQVSDPAHAQDDLRNGQNNKSTVHAVNFNTACDRAEVLG
ncbi:MAG: hypothetical protein ACOH2H_05940 [Cypionkella sp.]